MDTSGISKRDDGAWEMDTAAFLPEPQGYIKVKGEEFPIYSFLDIPVEDSMRVVKMSEEIDANPDYDNRMKRSIEHLLALNAGPDVGRETRKLLTPEHFKKFTARQIVGLVVLASTIAAVPTKADTESSANETASRLPAPASADSTAGTTGA
jgi:hypothetical protein